MLTRNFSIKVEEYRCDVCCMHFFFFLGAALPFLCLFGAVTMLCEPSALATEEI